MFKERYLLIRNLISVQRELLTAISRLLTTEEINVAKNDVRLASDMLRKVYESAYINKGV